MKERKPRRAVFLKVVLAVLLTTTSGLGMLYIYSLGLWWPTPNVLRYTWLAALGVTGGGYARLVLGKRTGALRFLTALFSVVAGLWTAEYITHGYVGFEVLYFDHPYPDYAGLIELGIPWLMAIIALRAWKKRKSQVPAARPAPEPAPAPVAMPLPASTKVKPVPVHLAQAGRRRKDLRNALNSAVAEVKKWPSKVSFNMVNTNLARGVVTEPRAFSQSLTTISKPALVRRSARTIISPGRQNTILSVSSETNDEHLCPYCLQDVDLNDPRGVKVCHICGAYHHADCWDVTGSCRARHH